MPPHGANYVALADKARDTLPARNSSPHQMNDANARRTNGVTWRRVLVACVGVFVLIASWYAAEVRPSLLLERGTLEAVSKFARGMFPPDFSPAFLRIVLVAVGQTLAIAVTGTFLSILIGLPLGIMATATLWRRGVLLAGERHNFITRMFAAFSRATLALLGFMRAVPDLVWGLLFVVAVGLGSLPGTLALAISYGGVLGRVYADVFEEVDARPLEALHAMGATRAQILLRAVLPQAAPSITAYTLYSFECCVRAASVLGFVGAGGIGYEINISMRLFEYGQVLTLILAFVALLALNDALSRRIRRRLRANVSRKASLLNRKSAISETAQRESVEAGAIETSDAAIRQTAAEQIFSGQLVLNNTRGVHQFKHQLNSRLKTYTLTFAVIVVLASSFYGSGLTNGALDDANLFARSGRFIGAMFPPETDFAFLRSLLKPLAQTIGISVIGTLIGVTIGALLALPATTTLVLHEHDEAGRRSRVEQFARYAIYFTARLILNALRSIPELVWVLICILAVGLGPFAGTLALGLHTGGVLGKLYAETLEDVPVKPIEAMRAAGARPLQILLWGILPQARPVLASYTVLRWEMNLRVSTILGLVGGGGLGQAIYNNIQLGFYPRVLTLIVVIYLLVISTDWAGEKLRVRQVSV